MTTIERRILERTRYHLQLAVEASDPAETRRHVRESLQLLERIPEGDGEGANRPPTTGETSEAE